MLEDIQDEKTRENQQYYNNKVNALKKCCEKFTNSFEKELKMSLKKYTGSPSSWKAKFEEAFNGSKGPMRASRLTSRTSKILHNICKNLDKFKNEEKFDVKKIDEYKKAFSFTAKKVKIDKKGRSLIKPSAIDNPGIVNYFTGQGSKFNSTLDNIPEIISNMAKCVEKENSSIFNGVDISGKRKNLMRKGQNTK